MALYCSRIGVDIQNFPIVPNRLDHCKIKTISRKLGLVAQCPQEQLIKDDYCVKQRPHLQLSLNMSQRTLYDCARDQKAKAKETRDAQKILSSNIYKRSLTESNSRNIWCNFSDYFIGNLRFQFLMFQTHNSCYKSKELDTNNCVEIMGIGLRYFSEGEQVIFSRGVTISQDLTGVQLIGVMFTFVRW